MLITHVQLLVLVLNEHHYCTMIYQAGNCFLIIAALRRFIFKAVLKINLYCLIVFTECIATLQNQLLVWAVVRSKSQQAIFMLDPVLLDFCHSLRRAFYQRDIVEDLLVFSID